MKGHLVPPTQKSFPVPFFGSDFFDEFLLREPHSLLATICWFIFLELISLCRKSDSITEKRWMKSRRKKMQEIAYCESGLVSKKSKWPVVFNLIMEWKFYSTKTRFDFLTLFAKIRIANLRSRTTNLRSCRSFLFLKKNAMESFEPEAYDAVHVLSSTRL